MLHFYFVFIIATGNKKIASASESGYRFNASLCHVLSAVLVKEGGAHAEYSIYRDPGSHSTILVDGYTFQ